MKIFNGITYTLTEDGKTPNQNVSYFAEDENDLIKRIEELGYMHDKHIGRVEGDKKILVFGRYNGFDNITMIIIDDFGT